MPRAGLTPAVVAAVAAELLDREPHTPIGFARLAAELGVKPPSLYNHIDGVDELERMIALGGIGELAERCRAAVMGLTGPEALHSLARAYRSYAAEHPGVYPLTQVARPGDPAYEEVAGKLLEAVIALLSGFGLQGEEAVHAARTVRSALHGFALLATNRGFGLDTDVDASFTWMMQALTTALADQA
ncbi:MAG: TetR-like C-terminal domain-containing protein [Acidimicrobiia bacterium]